MARQNLADVILNLQDSSCTFLFLQTTVPQARAMYDRVWTELTKKAISRSAIDLRQKISNLDEIVPVVAQLPRYHHVVGLEYAESIPSEKVEELNGTVKYLTDHVLCSMLWYLDFDLVGKLNSGYRSRAVSAFRIITSLEI